MACLFGVQKDKKLDSLTANDITYSYNLYVVLDQLSRLNAEAESGGVKVRLTPEELDILKKMVDDNDEDLLIYFEEYVEKSGPVYIESGQAWKSFLRFGKMAKEVHARSNRFRDAAGKSKKKGGGDDEEGEDGENSDEDEESDKQDEGDDEEGGGTVILSVCRNSFSRNEQPRTSV